MLGRMSGPSGPGSLTRLLVLTPDFPPARGGIQVLLHRLLTGLEGFDIRIVTLAGEGAGEFDAGSALSTRRVQVPARAGQLRNVALDAVALREAIAFRPALTLSAHIVTSPAAALIRRVFGARTVQYFYAKEIGNKPRLAAFAAHHADACISISAYTSQLLREHGARPSLLRQIAPGVDLPADAGALPAERPTVVTVSRLADRYKGHDVLVRALALVRRQVPDVEWVVVGDGPLRGEIESQVRAAGIQDTVRFVGAVSDQERDDWLRRADLLAMPSRLPEGRLAGEGFGIVYLEAGAFGKPVVAGNVAGALDAVEDGETGLLVDPTDAAAVAEAIATLLLDRSRAARMGAAGAERARRFAWPVMAERVGELLAEQLAAAGAGSRRGAT